MNKNISFIIISLLSLLAFSCGNTQYEKDIKLINQYITEHSLDTNNIFIDDYGVHYIETKHGVGRNVELTDSVVFAYSLRLINNIEVSFAINSEPFSANVSQLVQGLQLGMLNMKTYTKAVILIPSSLGYGAYSTGSIPSNSVLIFYVEMLKVIH